MPEELSKHSAITHVIDARNFRIAGQPELWAVLSKLFSFDEPAAKAQYLRKAARKQLDKRANFEALSLHEQGRVFISLFQDEDQIEDQTISRLVNFTFAFEDIKRFSKIAFATWCKQEWYSEPIHAAVAGLDLDLTLAEKLWLTNAILSAPSWIKLNKNDQWREDPRAQAVITFTEKLRDETAGKSDIDTQLLTKTLEIWQQILVKQRNVLPGGFLPNIILLVEGQTESLILPTFAKLLGADFNKLGVHIESCGGAKQVVKHYLNLKELTTLPIICVLDADVSESAEIISDSLRAQDRMLTMHAGELEDSFSPTTFHRLLNIYLKETGCLEPIAFSELHDSEGERIEVLDRLFRIRGLGNFDKIGFAETAVNYLHKSDVPDDGKRIIGTIEEVHDAGIKLRFQ